MAFDTTNLIPRLIDLDFKQVKFCSVSVEQYDKDSIYLETTLYNDSSPYIIPTGTTVSFGGTKPSSHIVLETATIENNKIYYKISEQCTVKEGDYPVKFTLYLPNGAVKYTQEFKIQVRKAVISSDAIADVDEVNVLNELIVDASGAITNANTATTNANNATTSATNAANLANEKAGLADTATTNANTATTNANTATGLANTATDRANVAATNAEAVVVGKTGINDAISNSTTEGWSSSKISGQIGDLTQLQTTSNTDLVGGINENKGSIDTIKTDIGDKTTLLTTIKTCIVNAINELVTSIATKINKSSIVNNGVTTTEGTVLDGRMGKTLQDQITAQNDKLAEGTWTPIILGSTVAGTNTYSTQVGFYAKIGNTVICWFTIVIQTKDANMQGTVLMGGFPFPGDPNNGGSLSQTIGVTFDTGRTVLGFRVDGTFATFYSSGSNIAPTTIDAARISNGMYLRGTVVYKIKTA